MITETESLYHLTTLAHLGLFLIAPIVLFRRGWLVSAGVLMMASTLLPIARQTWFTASEMPGLGFLLIVEAPFAVLVFVAGVVFSVSRRWRNTKAR